MAIDKILITHIVTELVIICGISYYYHIKCNKLKLQIEELNNKIDKLNINNYILAIKKQEQFEIQTVQQINKLYSLINTNEINQRINEQNVNTNEKINQRINEQNSNILFNPIYNLNESVNNHEHQEKKQFEKTNPFFNTLSVLGGPLSTMFQVVMEKKPPHPNELFQNINVNKIVEIEDEDETNNSEHLDEELRDELDDLNSTSTTTMNTPIVTPKHPFSQSKELDLCEDGICNLSNETTKQSIILKSSPLRYISQVPEQKRGRPKKNI